MKTRVVTSTLLLSAILLIAGCRTTSTPQRFGSVIGLKADQLVAYKQLHAEAWPEVLAMLKVCNISNYSIYLTQMDDDQYYLFSHFEYTGDNITDDFAKMGQDPMTQKWWALTDPMQNPLKNRNEGEHWKSMEEVFYMP